MTPWVSYPVVMSFLIGIGIATAFLSLCFGVRWVYHFFRDAHQYYKDRLKEYGRTL